MTFRPRADQKPTDCEVEDVECFAGRQVRLGEAPGEAALTSVGELLLGERRKKARGGPAFLVGGGGERAPDELHAGEAQLGKKKIDACGVDFVVGLHATTPSREASAS